jgi:hypothetical protein
MRGRLLVLFCLLCCLTVATAQPLLDRRELSAIPLPDAVVLDPAIGWPDGYLLAKNATELAAIERHEDRLLAVVAEPGKFQQWQLGLTVPVDVQRYPFAVVTYRASGLAARDEGLIEMCANGFRPVLANRDAIADGEVHEVVLELPGLGFEEGAITHLWVRPYCAGPEPAVFELLGLRFESDGRLPPEDAGPAPEFAVHVVGADGKPLAGATVTLDPGVLNAARSAVTGADGQAMVRALAIAECRHSLRVTKDGMVPVEIVPEDGKDLPRKVVLVPGTRYGGIVRNEAGEPVPSVVVCLDGMSLDGTEQGRYWQARMLTDATGRWLSPVLPLEPPMRDPELRHPDYRNGRVHPDSAEALRQGKATMVIPRGTDLTGTVLGPDGHPVPDADVRMISYADYQGRSTEITIHLPAPTRLTGQVVDPQGKPVPHAVIRVDQWGAFRSLDWRTEADRDGRFSWENAPADRILASVRARNRMGLDQFPIRAADSPVRIVLPSVLVVTGKVVDPATKEPVSGCRVFAGSVPAEQAAIGPRLPSEERPDDTTDRRGRFRVTLRQAGFGQFGVLKFVKDGYAPTLSSLLPLDGGAAELEIALPQGRDIEGVLLLPNGKPAADTAVYMATPGTGVTVLTGVRVPYFRGTLVNTDADGRFGLPATLGKWRLAAFCTDGYLDVADESFPESGELRMRPWARLEGRCLTDGKPAAGCPVGACPYPYHDRPGEAQVSYMLSATTDGQGEFSIANVPGGLVSVLSAPAGAEHVFVAGSRERMVVTVAGQTSHVAIGTEGRTVVGRVALAEGIAGTVDWAAVRGQLVPQFELPEKLPELPATWQTMSPQERAAWMDGAEGRAYQEGCERYGLACREAAARQKLPFCRVKIEEDGRFRVSGLPPATYLVKLSARVSPEGGETLGERHYVRLEHTFVLPALPEGGADEPLDLGTLEAKLRE